MYSATTYADNVTLLAFAAERLLLGDQRPPRSIDISCPSGPQQQTRRSSIWRPNNGTVNIACPRRAPSSKPTARRYTG